LISTPLELPQHPDALAVLPPPRNGQGRELVGNRFDRESVTKRLDLNRPANEVVEAAGDIRHYIQGAVLSLEQVVKGARIGGIRLPVEARLALSRVSLALYPPMFSVVLQVPVAERPVGIGPSLDFRESTSEADKIRATCCRRDIQIAGGGVSHPLQHGRC
jgi:hypothetical protein